MSPQAGIVVEVFSPIQEFTKVKVEPVGKWFAHFQECKANENNIQNSTVDVIEDNNEDDELSDDFEVEENTEYLRQLNPKDWKNQDHYAVLGLKEKRIFAKEAEIKKAFRKKVLVHHPDKRRGAGEKVKDLDHDYFSCITKAYEIIGNPTKRQSYDSVDPEFDDSVPSVNNSSKEKFFEVFQPVFEANSRWSVKQPVPSLGNKDSSFEEVDRFYSFWYDFDSWREFSYLDEEEKEKGENREERKWIEKQNRIARQKHKKDEMARIRQLVDNAYACDPRIMKFKEEEKKRKAAQKKAKEEAVRLKAQEKKRKELEALVEKQKQREREEEELKIKKEKEKKEKEAIKKQQKRERKLLQQICESNNYFSSDDETKLCHLKEVDKLCNLLSLQRLQDLNAALQKEENKKNVFLQEVESLNKQLETEKEQLFASAQRSSANNEEKSSERSWSPADLQLLVKGVNLFPAGTNNRWEVVATFMAQHSTTNIKRTAKEVLAKVKELQKKSGGLREQINKSAYENLEKTQKQVPITVKDQSAPTERFDNELATPGQTETWTAEEQQLLEQALKTYPASEKDRWDKIASCIPGRDKKDCIKRYKDLVEMVKAKKAAQAVAAPKSKK